MSSLELEDNAELEPRTKTGTLVRLLDPAFGFFVFAIHFLVIYIAQAMVCVLGLGIPGAGTHSGFLWALALLTVVSAAIVVGHGIRRLGQQRRKVNQQFRMAMTLGNDAIATVAILLQFFPIFLAPVCA